MSHAEGGRATRKELRSTGLVVGIAFAVLGGLQVLFHGHLARPPYIHAIFGASALLILLGWLAPPLLRPFHYAWMKFALALGWVMNRVILGILFFVVFTLMALVMRLVRRDALQIRSRETKESYWIPRPDVPAQPARYERQF